jgi:uncharacterized membrane protein YczE
MKKFEKKKWKRFFIYIVGMVILALGISLNAKTSLGVSPIISTAYCVSTITGYNFGNMTFVLYVFFVCVEIVIHLAGKRKREAALSLNMRIVPNPGDGIVQTIADAVKKDNGFVKNCVDITCVIITCTTGLIFARKIIGIGIGTLMAMIGVGRVIAVFNKLTRKQTEALLR